MHSKTIKHCRPLFAASLLASVSLFVVAPAHAQSAPLYPTRAIEGTNPPRDGLDWQQMASSQPLYPGRGLTIQEPASTTSIIETLAEQPIPQTPTITAPAATAPPIVAPSLATSQAAPTIATTRPQLVAQAAAPRILPLPQNTPAQTPEFKPFATIETQGEVPIDPSVHALPKLPQVNSSNRRMMSETRAEAERLLKEFESDLDRGSDYAVEEIPDHPGSFRSEQPVTKLPAKLAAPKPIEQTKTVPASPADLAILEELEKTTIQAAPKRRRLESPPNLRITSDEQPERLSDQSKRILSKIPRGVDSPPKQTIRKTSIDRFDPEIEGILNGDTGEEEEEVATHESMGVKIQVRRPSLDVNQELKSAYSALVSGQPHLAVQIYKDILRQSPRNQDALFGIATTFHRLNEIDLARPFYGRLLSINPGHRDGLTNFLTLIADESPDDAVERLQSLMVANPDFSPIPAQLGILFDEMGARDEAIDAMIRAIRLSPENVAYKYNLAVMYDKYDMVADATILYNQLLEAGRSGIALPAEMSDIQRRVIHINTRNRG